MNISKIHYINLDQDSERRSLIEERLARYFRGIPVERFAAIGADRIKKFESFYSGRLESVLQPVNGVFPRPGNIGCFLSHYQLLRKIAATLVEEPVLVMEDDCVFDGSVPRALRRLGRRCLPPDWRVIKHSLGQCVPDHRVNRKFYNVSAAAGMPWQFYWGTHFLIYRPRFVPEIIRKMESRPICAIDGWMKNHLEGVYSFARYLHIKQNNLGGSRTNPDFAAPHLEDRDPGFPIFR